MFVSIPNFFIASLGKNEKYFRNRSCNYAKNNKLSPSLLLSLFLACDMLVFSTRLGCLQENGLITFITIMFNRKVQLQWYLCYKYYLWLILQISNIRKISRNLTFSSSLFYQNFVFYAQAFSLSNTNIHVHCHGHIDSCLLDLP